MFKIADVDVSFFLCNAAHPHGRVWSTENKNAFHFLVYLKGQIHEIFNSDFYMNQMYLSVSNCPLFVFSNILWNINIFRSLSQSQWHEPPVIVVLTTGDKFSMVFSRFCSFSKMSQAHITTSTYFLLSLHYHLYKMRLTVKNCLAWKLSFFRRFFRVKFWWKLFPACPVPRPLCFNEKKMTNAKLSLGNT